MTAQNIGKLDIVLSPNLDKLKTYLDLDNQFLGMLGETYCQKFLFQQNIACTRPQNISLKEILEKPTIMFDYNNRRIEVTVPEAIRGEVYKMGQTTTKFKPRYLYDFLAYRLGTDDPPWKIRQSAVEDFMWVEAKSGQSKPSEAQIAGVSQTKIPVMLCRSEGVLLNTPEDVGMDFYEL